MSLTFSHDSSLYKLSTLSLFSLSVQQPPADTSEAQNEESVLEGALAVQPLSRNLAGFDTYFKSLGPSHGTINPWFEECLREYCKRPHSGAHYRLPSLQVSFLTEYSRLPLSSSSSFLVLLLLLLFFFISHCSPGMAMEGYSRPRHSSSR